MRSLFKVIDQLMTQENTILNFSDQKSGAQGLMVTSDDGPIEKFCCIGCESYFTYYWDAIKVKGSDGISFINVRTEWSVLLRTQVIEWSLWALSSRVKECTHRWLHCNWSLRCRNLCWTV